MGPAYGTFAICHFTPVLSPEELFRPIMSHACDHPDVVLSPNGFHSLVRKELVVRIGYREAQKLDGHHTFASTTNC
jgi:hypothetical protein